MKVPIWASWYVVIPFAIEDKINDNSNTRSVKTDAQRNIN